MKKLSKSIDFAKQSIFIAEGFKLWTRYLWTYYVCSTVLFAQLRQLRTTSWTYRCLNVPEKSPKIQPKYPQKHVFFRLRRDKSAPKQPQNAFFCTCSVQMIRKNILWRIRFPFWASSEVLHLQRTRERRACDLQTSGKEDYPNSNFVIGRLKQRW